MAEEGVAAGRLRDPDTDHGLADQALQRRLVKVVPPALASLPMPVRPGCGEDPLPAPLPARVGVLATEGVGQLDPPRASGQVDFVLRPDPVEVGSQGAAHHGREHRPAVSPALPATGILMVAGSSTRTERPARAPCRARRRRCLHRP